MPKIKKKIKINIKKTFTNEHRIVEFSFNSKINQFVVRFITGDIYLFNIKKLPKNMLTKNPVFAESFLNPEQNIIVFRAGVDIIRGISAILIKEAGKKME